MRPGFLIGVVAFGLLVTAVFLAFGIARGATSGQLLKFGLLIFGAFTAGPLVIAVIQAPRGAALFRHGGAKHSRTRTALLVFGILVIAAVVTVAVVYLLQ